MPDISKITLPSGNTYDIKDAVARDAIAALEGGSYFLGVTTTALTDQATTNPITVGGQSVTAKNGNIVVYGNAEFVFNGTKWFEFGDLSTLGTLAYKDTVSLSKGSGDNVLGEATTFTNSSSSVSFSGGTTDKVLGSDATFTTTVTPTTTNIKATASGTAVGANGTDTFVKSYPGATSKLSTTTVPNVTAAGSPSTWSFSMGSGTDADTLIISGTNSTAPTLGTAITVATGSLAANGGGSSVMTGLGTATTASALTGVKVTTQPTISLATGATAGTGVISVATGITSASTTTNNKDEVTAVTGVGTGTAAAQTITVGTNDKVKVAKYNDLSVSTS